MKKLGENVRLRIISVFIAIILWIFVVSIQNPEIKKEYDNIPVKISSLDLLSDYGLVPVETKNYMITVKVKGNQDSVKKIDAKDIEATADIRAVKQNIVQGALYIPVSISIIGAEGVEILDKDKYGISINLDKNNQVQKMIEVVFQGEKQKDARYEIKSVKPNAISISGPQSLVKNIGSIKVFIDASSVNKDISVVKSFRIYTKEGKDITNNEQMAKDNQNIQIEIGYSKVKEVKLSTDIQGSPLEGYYLSQVTTNPEKVTISGPAEKVDAIEFLSTRKINISGVKTSFQKELPIILPNEVKIEYTGNVKVNIYIEKEDSRIIDVPKTNISFVNTSDDLVYKVISPKARVYLEGRKGSLELLDAENLGLFVNVQGYSPGEYVLPVSMEYEDQYRIQEKTPDIKISISKKK